MKIIFTILLYVVFSNTYGNGNIKHYYFGGDENKPQMLLLVDWDELEFRFYADYTAIGTGRFESTGYIAKQSDNTFKLINDLKSSLDPVIHATTHYIDSTECVSIVTVFNKPESFDKSNNRYCEDNNVFVNDSVYYVGIGVDTISFCDVIEEMSISIFNATYHSETFSFQDDIRTIYIYYSFDERLSKTQFFDSESDYLTVYDGFTDVRITLSGKKYAFIEMDEGEFANLLLGNWVMKEELGN